MPSSLAPEHVAGDGRPVGVEPDPAVQGAGDMVLGNQVVRSALDGDAEAAALAVVAAERVRHLVADDGVVVAVDDDPVEVAGDAVGADGVRVGAADDDPDEVVRDRVSVDQRPARAAGDDPFVVARDDVVRDLVVGGEEVAMIPNVPLLALMLATSALPPEFWTRNPALLFRVETTRRTALADGPSRRMPKSNSSTVPPSIVTPS